MADAAFVEARLRQLLEAVGFAGELDPDISSYLTAVILDEDDEESSVSTLAEVLADTVAPFAACSEARQQELILHLLHEVRCRSCEQPPPQHAQHDHPQRQQQQQQHHLSVNPLVAAIRQVSVSEGGACADITNSERAASGSGTSTSSSNGGGGAGPPPPDVSALLELCQGLFDGPQQQQQHGSTTAFLQHAVVHRFHGDLQAAADWLLDAGPGELARQQAAWQQQQEAAARAQAQAEHERRQAKRLIVERFDLRAVSSASGGGGSSKGGAPPDLLPRKAQQKEEGSKVRYRDGKVASMKGEKVIIERVGEEWDGGSRGKVYTKGKRGKGFH